MAKKLTKKPSKREFVRATSPEMNAKAVIDYAKGFRVRCLKMAQAITEAGMKMERTDPDFTVRPIVSMIDRYLDEIERRIDSQFSGKAVTLAEREKAMQKVRSLKVRRTKD